MIEAELFQNFCAYVQELPFPEVLWCLPYPNKYKNRYMLKHELILFVRKLLESHDPKENQLGTDAMLYKMDRYYESENQRKYVEECRQNAERLRERRRK